MLFRRYGEKDTFLLLFGVVNLFNSYLEKIMQKTLHDQQTSTSIGWRPTRNLRFADDIDFTNGSNGELQDLTNRLRPLSEQRHMYGMEINTEKSKIKQHEQQNCRY